jgi:hypothetical protein
MAFALMNVRRASSYKMMWQKLSDRCEAQTGRPLSPRKIVSDYEVSQVKHLHDTAIHVNNLQVKLGAYRYMVNMHVQMEIYHYGTIQHCKERVEQRSLSTVRHLKFGFQIKSLLGNSTFKILF